MELSHAHALAEADGGGREAAHEVGGEDAVNRDVALARVVRPLRWRQQLVRHMPQKTIAAPWGGFITD